MCLQWCHVTRQLIDNDLPCIGCTRFVRPVATSEQTCANCTHRRDREGQASFCSLSCAPLPRKQVCCHWNVEREMRSVLQLRDSDVGPGVLEMWGVGRVASLFAHSDSAPAVITDASGCVTVRLDELAIPLVYGVVAAHWDGALDADAALWPAEGSDGAVPPELASAVVALLDALDSAETHAGAPDDQCAQAYAALEAALIAYPISTLPDAWQHLVTQALELCAQQEAHIL